MKTYTLPSLLTGLLLSNLAYSDEQNNEIEKIEVKGELLPTSIKQAAKAVDIVNQSSIEQLGANHIQDILLQVGNVNYSSGSSRARFFQVRGIGERSQFVDPINPSVGTAIDGIDYSGIGAAATLFDISQVEVYKGPQGSNIGANAMAGFINLSSTETGSDQSAKLRLEAGNYGYKQLAAAYGGDLGEKAEYRASISKLTGDGYIHNAYLNRDDTNGFDELTMRFALDVAVNKDWLVKAVVHKFDIDNGYDAFSLDLNRTTLSDQPGFDKQDTTALGLTNLYRGLNNHDLKLFISHSDSDLAYGYDEDWAYQGIAPYDPVNDPNGYFAEYSSTDHYFRQRDAQQIDFSVSDKNKTWVLGLYRQAKEVDLQRDYTWLSERFDSNYQVENLALYGEKRLALTNDIQVTIGGRIEQYEGDYQDSNSVVADSEHVMWGGHVSAQKRYNSEFMSYIRLARGFKAGSVNGEALSRLNEAGLERFYFELKENASFDPEALTNVELGLRFNSDDRQLNASATLFYSERDDMQIKQWLTNDKEVAQGQQPIFVGYISNVPSGANYGLETALAYQLLPALRLYGSVALLETEVDDIQRLQTDPTSGLDITVDISGREQAHAPDYQYTLGADWQITDSIVLNANTTGRGGYFYSYSHDEVADSADLLNLSLTYRADAMDVTIWARNITDEDYTVRGFYFGNDPRDGYTGKAYEQFGEPSVYGIRLDYVF